MLRAAEAYHGGSLMTQAWNELHRGILDLERGRLDEAMAHYRAADDICSGWWLIEEHIAEVLAENGERDAAAALYVDIIERTGLPEFMTAMAELELAAEDVEASRTWAARAEATYVRRMAHFRQAVVGHALEHWIAFGEPADAVELARENAASSPNGDALAAFTRALVNAGDLQRAAAAADRAVGTGFSSADLPATAAEAFEGVGRTADAETQWSLARQIDPSSGR